MGLAPVIPVKDALVMCSNMPRVVITGLTGGTGKTMISVGLARAMSRRGLRVQTFKKGPDYIDTLYLSLASGTKPRNLDPYMVDKKYLPYLFEKGWNNNGQKADIAIIEGNRGLFDGQDIDGSCSTAELARLLAAPVVMGVNCTKVTRTVAAMVLGCKNFEPDVNLTAVILNQLGRERHRIMVQSSVEQLAHVPVAGAIPRLDAAPLDERRSGLLGEEAVLGEADIFERLDTLADIIEKHVDVDRIIEIARSAPPLTVTECPPALKVFGKKLGRKLRIGYVRDVAFWFYYTENLEALHDAGAELVELSLLDDCEWPDIDALYIGSGYPEDYAERLAANDACKERVMRLIAEGLPIYAEGSGCYYLARNIKRAGQYYPMCGAFDVDIEFEEKPQSLGYAESIVSANNPFFDGGLKIRGHEFHYCRMVAKSSGINSVFEVQKGIGLEIGRKITDKGGLLINSCLASFMQVFAPGMPQWVEGLVQAAEQHALEQEG